MCVCVCVCVCVRGWVWWYRPFARACVVQVVCARVPCSYKHLDLLAAYPSKTELRRRLLQALDEGSNYGIE